MEVQTPDGADHRDCPECYGRGESPDGVLKYWVWRIYHGKFPALIFLPWHSQSFFSWVGTDANEWAGPVGEHA